MSEQAGVPPAPAEAIALVPAAGPVLRTALARQASAEPRLVAYAGCLSVAFLLYLAVHGPGRGAGFWSTAFAVLAAIGWGAAGRAILEWARGRSGSDAPSRWLDAGCGGAALCALAVPFGATALQGAPLARAFPLWPQILVLLFAGRLLAETAEARFVAFWRGPLGSAAPAPSRSITAALALGACLALTVYHLVALIGVPRHAAADTSLMGALLAAAAGESAVHRAIVMLACVILAFLGLGLAGHRRERAALHALRDAARGWEHSIDPAAGAARVLAPLGPTRTEFLVREALVRNSAGPPDGARALAFETLHGDSRRFVRGLVALLPLLGFLGTVVGLSAAMAGLPLNATAGGRPDLTASLGGLALKFETTMLGLVASMVATVALVALERAEAGHEAACLVLGDALRARHAR